jgi:hypothetical protein
MWIRISFLLTFICFSGCSAIQVIGGYSFEGARAGKAIPYKSCGETFQYFSKPLYDRIDITDQESFQESYTKGDIWINLEIVESYSTHWLTVGPGIIIPVPIIPRPYGIGSELFSSTIPIKTFSVNIYLETNTSSYVFNPNSVLLIQGENIVKPIVEKGNEIVLSPDKFASFRLRYYLPTSSREPMKLTFKGLSKHGQIIALNDPSIIFNKSVSFYWTVINC